MKIIHADDSIIEFTLDPDDFMDFRIGYLGEIVLTKEPWDWLASKNLDSLTLRELESKIEPYTPPSWTVYELWDGTRFLSPTGFYLTPNYPFILADFQSLSEATKALQDMEVPDEEAS